MKISIKSGGDDNFVVFKSPTAMTWKQSYDYAQSHKGSLLSVEEVRKFIAKKLYYYYELTGNQSFRDTKEWSQLWFFENPNKDHWS